MVGVDEAKKREVRAVEKRSQKEERRARIKYELGTNKRANHQKHFRVSLFFLLRGVEESLGFTDRAF